MYEDYELIEANSAAELDTKMAVAIAAGKQPIGSVAVNSVHNGTVFTRLLYTQAVGTPAA
ncbi:MAG: hypothetical protein AB7V08_13845 [Elusimicrobiales bacterium]